MVFGAVSAGNVSDIIGTALTRGFQQYQNQVCTHFFYKIVRQQSCEEGLMKSHIYSNVLGTITH